MSLETKHSAPGNAHGGGEPGYERRDAKIKPLLQFAFWMAVVLAITLFGMAKTFSYFEKLHAPGSSTSQFATERQLPPSPRLQTAPHSDLKSYCVGQQQEVNTYGWIDKRLGVVRIPVGRAMDLVLQNGLPVRPSSQAPSGAAAVPPTALEFLGTKGEEGPCGYLAPKTGDTPDR